MKIFKHNLARSNRHGLSVIEVLTSIVVALIGVFGVLAMIPFSVKQTQSGLDQDAATSMARNALSDFEARGFKVVSGSDSRLNWALATDPTTPLTALAGGPLVCIDPLGFQEDTMPMATFPFNSTIPITIPRVNLLSPTGMFSPADARRMFRLTDDLVFEQSDDPTDQDADLAGPQQIFNEDGSGSLNRQSTGAVSWCAIAQPIVNSATATEVDSYKFNVLVFKDRVMDSDPSVEESRMAAAVVTSPTADTFANPLSSVAIDTALRSDDFPMRPDIRRNDWVMLINQAPGTDPISFRTNVAFARVSNLFSDEASNTARITLDGPNFNFTGTTYLVHLKDVVAVFPRTIKLETLSGWNVSD